MAALKVGLQLLYKLAEESLVAGILGIEEKLIPAGMDPGTEDAFNEA